MTEDAPESLGELAWFEYESHRDNFAHVDTESSAERMVRLQRAREVSRNVRRTMAFLRTLGWPGRWPRELLITYRGRE